MRHVQALYWIILLLVPTCTIQARQGRLTIAIDTPIIDDMTYYIYGLERDNTIYYIGRTKNVKQRKRQHKYLGRTGKLIILAVCNDTDAKELERYYIHKHKHTLENKRERYYSGVDGKDIILNR